MVFSLRNRATGREKKRSLFQKELVIVEGKTKFDPIREKEEIATFVVRVLFSRKRETMVHRRGGLDTSANVRLATRCFDFRDRQIIEDACRFSRQPK